MNKSIILKREKLPINVDASDGALDLDEEDEEGDAIGGLGLLRMVADDEAASSSPINACHANIFSSASSSVGGQQMMEEMEGEGRGGKDEVTLDVEEGVGGSLVQSICDV